jgi:hypothetical protein
MPNNNEVRIAESAIREKEKEIRFKVKPFRIEDLVKKFTKDQFYIPDYQREDVWTFSLKSKFIESVLLGLPIPDIFVCETSVDEDDYDKLTQFEIIDGSQRIRTLAGFVEGKFFLKNLETIKELEEFYFDDLTDYRKDKFKDTTIDVIILSAATSEEVKNEMFDRINTSSPLKVMELRRGSYAGPFNDLIRTCGDLIKNNYSDICPINKHFKNRREEEELALRFFAFSETYEDNLSFVNTLGKKIKKQELGTEEFLTEFYDYQNKRLKEIEKADKIEYQREVKRFKTNFKEVLDFVKKNFPRGFKREKSGSVARVVFEAIAVGVFLSIKRNPSLKTKNIDTSWFKTDKNFKNAINQKYGLHKANKIIQRIEIVLNNLVNQ